MAASRWEGLLDTRGQLAFSLRWTDGHADMHAHLPVSPSPLTLSFSPLPLPVAGRVGELFPNVFCSPLSEEVLASREGGCGGAAKPCHKEFEQLRGDRVGKRAFLQRCRIAHTPHPNNQGSLLF